MNISRRELIALAGAWTSSTALASPSGQGSPASAADITLRIAELTLDLAPRRSVRTIAYNGQVPGPLLRARAGRPLTVEVWNDTREDELVHWHGLHIPADVDGAREEGTPVVPARGRQRYTFVPQPIGTRWYHSHGMANGGVSKSTYTGQFGMLIVESGDDPGSYDVEVPILLHEWEPRIGRDGSPAVIYRSQSINGKMLGFGEPIRVRQGQRALLRIVNASATLHHRLAFAGHVFEVIALDGFAVPRPGRVPVVGLAPGERVDAIVELDQPGIWVLGEVDNQQRAAGMGIVVEYAGSSGSPAWHTTRPFDWEYAAFGDERPLSAPDARLQFVFRATDDRRHWTINGKSHLRGEHVVLEQHKRYRWLLDNQSAEPHPIHLHRHAFELVGSAGVAVGGIRKDVVVVPAWKQMEVEVAAEAVGPSLLHCHHQHHMDMGFMTMVHCVTDGWKARGHSQPSVRP
jgi:FtsP/CotA-like multicopper oxidase with cupredoxin domain